mmetsp:Transcript_10583/g.17278  ORF Transcript_10583/g.17278 Transcript_10583/m.17278 type:complete len:919 (+) Transcript_10583:280-3036(+)
MLFGDRVQFRLPLFYIGRRRRRGSPTAVKMYLCCLSISMLVFGQVGNGFKVTEHDKASHVAANWDFEESLGGWAHSTFEEIGARIYLEGGELRGRIDKGDKIPRFDSPMMTLDASDKYVVGMRIRHGAPISKYSAVQVRMFEPGSIDIDVQALDVEFGGGQGVIITVPFEEAVSPDGSYHIIYARVYEKVQGRIAQLRILPVTKTDDETKEVVHGSSGFEIDWIKLIKVPTLERVEGCLDKYFSNVEPRPNVVDRMIRDDGVFVHRSGSSEGHVPVETKVLWSNGDRHIYHQAVFQEDPDAKYATTYNCPREGLGWRIRLSGRNFGDYESFNNVFWDTILIDGKPCTDVKMVQPQQVVECTLPEISKDSRADRVDVMIRQPDHRMLYDTKPFLSYAVPAPRVGKPTVSNIASHSIDLSWKAPADLWDANTITGYRVTGKVKDNKLPIFHHDVDESRNQLQFREIESIILGNVTTTTVTKLEPNRLYYFHIEALVEDPRNPDWRSLDLYGRRPQMIKGGITSVPSLPTDIVSTLGHDVNFGVFDANGTLDHGAIDSRSTIGPSRNEHGEGHYGLIIVGDANVENCNASTTCCDYTSGSCKLRCRVDADASVKESLHIDATRLASTNKNGGSFVESTNEPDATDPVCGPAFRLTGAAPRATGAMWYPRKLNVREGFVTEFSFRISNPSQVCKVMDDVATRCRSKGAEGLALVLHNDNDYALGVGGMDLGYGGISNSIVVEFDTFFNHENIDPYENHVAIMSRGQRGSAISNHASAELASIVSPVDLTDGEVKVRVEYHPSIREEDQQLLFTDTFVANAHLSSFISGRVEGERGLPEIVEEDGGTSQDEFYGKRDWLNGVGWISIYINDFNRPVLTTVLNLESTINLDSGRSWVGFTAATGDSFWQAHDILDWKFDSLRFG